MADAIWGRSKREIHYLSLLHNFGSDRKNNESKKHTQLQTQTSIPLVVPYHEAKRYTQSPGHLGCHSHGKSAMVNCPASRMIPCSCRSCVQKRRAIFGGSSLPLKMLYPSYADGGRLGRKFKKVSSSPLSKFKGLSSHPTNQPIIIKKPEKHSYE